MQLNDIDAEDLFSKHCIDNNYRLSLEYYLNLKWESL